MAIPTKQRWIFYLIALALTLIAVKWAGGEDSAKSAAPAARPAERADRPVAAGTAAAPAAAPEVQLNRLGARARSQAGGDLFRALSWQALAQDEVRRSAGPSLPPPPPQAPPLPYSYLGKLIEAGKTTVFLTKEDRNYIVRAGDTLDGTYGVETVDEQQAVLNYLPLGIRQTLSYAPAGGVPLADAQGVSPPAPGRDDQEKDD